MLIFGKNNSDNQPKSAFISGEKKHQKKHVLLFSELFYQRKKNQ
jgi:hypothetical protein